MHEPDAPQQFSVNDSFNRLTPRVKKMIHSSWARYFREEVFPRIDESRFEVLYSDETSRPEAPVNVLVGALIIKEMLGLSDIEMVETLVFDVCAQYALHTTGAAEQPLFDDTLACFRNRYADYMAETGIDLIQDCMAELADYVRQAMKMTKRVRKPDALKVAASIRRLSQIERVFRLAADVVLRDHENGIEMPVEAGYFLNRHFVDQVFRRLKSKEQEAFFQKILADSSRILSEADPESEEYDLLKSCLEEQRIQA